MDLLKNLARSPRFWLCVAVIIVVLIVAARRRTAREIEKLP